MSVFDWYTISIILGAILAIISYFFYRWKNEKFHLLCAIFLSYISILEIIGRYYFIKKINNIIIYNFGFVLAEILLILLLYHLIFRNRKYSKFLLYSGLFFILYFVFNALYLQSITIFQSYTYMVGSLIIISFSMLFFYEEVQKSNQVWDNLILNPEFWTVSLMGVFFASTIFGFTAMNTINEQMSIDLILQIFSLIRVVGAIMYLGMGAALLICSYKFTRSKKMA